MTATALCGTNKPSTEYYPCQLIGFGTFSEVYVKQHLRPVHSLRGGFYRHRAKAVKPSAGDEIVVVKIPRAVVVDTTGTSGADVVPPNPDFRMMDGSTMRELNALTRLAKRVPNHPHFIPLLDTALQWLGKDGAGGMDVALIFPFMKGGDLASHIRKMGELEHLNPRLKHHPNRLLLIQSYANQLLTGVSPPVHRCSATLMCVCSQVDHMHRKGKVLHRDLKPANLLLDGAGVLKIADFGLSEVLGGHCKRLQMNAYVVTPCYRPPEVCFRGIYAEPIDLWSVGCIIAELFTRKLLFPTDPKDEKGKIKDEKTQDRELLSCIVQRLGPLPTGYDEMCYGERKASDMLIDKPNVFERLESIDELKSDSLLLDLIRGLLRYDPNERLTAEQALSHPWFDGYYARMGSSSSSVNEPLLKKPKLFHPSVVPSTDQLIVV